jgi:hypothetical protein
MSKIISKKMEVEMKKTNIVFIMLMLTLSLFASQRFIVGEVFTETW